MCENTPGPEPVPCPRAGGSLPPRPEPLARTEQPVRKKLPHRRIDKQDGRCASLNGQGCEPTARVVFTFQCGRKWERRARGQTLPLPGRYRVMQWLNRYVQRHNAVVNPCEVFAVHTGR